MYAQPCLKSIVWLNSLMSFLSDTLVYISSWLLIIRSSIFWHYKSIGRKESQASDPWFIAFSKEAKKEERKKGISYLASIHKFISISHKKWILSIIRNALKVFGRENCYIPSKLAILAIYDNIWLFRLFRLLWVLLR